jgi:hypothetical protein
LIVCTKSAVRLCSCVKEVKAAVVGRGMDSPSVTRRGMRSSMNSSSGGIDKGENSGYARDCSNRVWWRRCEDNAVCAVISLSKLVGCLRGDHGNKPRSTAFNPRLSAQILQSFNHPSHNPIPIRTIILSSPPCQTLHHIHP